MGSAESSSWSSWQSSHSKVTNHGVHSCNNTIDHAADRHAGHNHAGHVAEMGLQERCRLHSRKSILAGLQIRGLCRHLKTAPSKIQPNNTGATTVMRMN